MRRRKSSSISSSASSPARCRPAGPRAGRHRHPASSSPRSGAQRRLRRDLDERHAVVREHEDRLHVVDEDRPLAVERAQVRQTHRDVGRARQLEEVGDERLLVVQVQHGVAEHGPHRARSVGPVRTGPMVPLRVVEVDDEADATARHPHADADAVVGGVHQVHVVAAVGLQAARSGRSDGCPSTALNGLPERQPRFSAQR